MRATRARIIDAECRLALAIVMRLSIGEVTSERFGSAPVRVRVIGAHPTRNSMTLKRG
jgi:hypothetical protein